MSREGGLGASIRQIDDLSYSIHETDIISFVDDAGRENLDHAALRVFLAVVREGGFSRAAKGLYRSQPAVSAAVSRLEEQ
ncbi:MAG: LysR family transcriptional regulator, partial [Acidobacteriota bacterium]